MASGRTTASFSRAMSATVGPSQRVCSRPTLVSTTTGARSTPVASWRPPRPASTTATSTPRRASSSNAAAVISSNWVTRSPGSSPRSTFAAAAAARCTAAPNASGSRSRSPIRIRSANVVRCGERNAPVRTPCASSSAAVMRTVELLPFVPTTWIALKRSCGVPSAVSSRRMRSSPKRMPNSSSPSRCSSARSADQVTGRALLAQPCELVALGRDHRLRRLGHEALVGQLLLGARDLGLQPAAALVDPPRRRAEVDGVGLAAPRPRRPAPRPSPPDRRRRATTPRRASRATCSAVRS